MSKELDDGMQVTEPETIYPQFKHILEDPINELTKAIKELTLIIKEKQNGK